MDRRGEKGVSLGGFGTFFAPSGEGEKRQINDKCKSVKKGQVFAGDRRCEIIGGGACAQGQNRKSSYPKRRAGMNATTGVRVFSVQWEKKRS